MDNQRRTTIPRPVEMPANDCCAECDLFDGASHPVLVDFAAEWALVVNAWRTGNAPRGVRADHLYRPLHAELFVAARPIALPFGAYASPSLEEAAARVIRLAERRGIRELALRVAIAAENEAEQAELIERARALFEQALTAGGLA